MTTKGKELSALTFEAIGILMCLENCPEMRGLSAEELAYARPKGSTVLTSIKELEEGGWILWRDGSWIVLAPSKSSCSE